MPNLKKLFRTVKPFLGNFEMRIDRSRQLIYFIKNGKTEILTVPQLFDEIESVFTRVSMATKAGEMADPAINRPSWLSLCEKPVTDPLGNNSQALIEPARAL